MPPGAFKVRESSARVSKSEPKESKREPKVSQKGAKGRQKQSKREPTRIQKVAQGCKSCSDSSLFTLSFLRQNDENGRGALACLTLIKSSDAENVFLSADAFLQKTKMVSGTCRSYHCKRHKWGEICKKNRCEENIGFWTSPQVMPGRTSKTT